MTDQEDYSQKVLLRGWDATNKVWRDILVTNDGKLIIDPLQISCLAHTHDGDTLQLDGVNSDGGAFPLTTTGDITLSQNLILADGKYVKIDKVRAIDGDGLLLEDDGGNGIEVVDGGIIHMAKQSAIEVALSDDDDIPNSTPTVLEFDTETIDVQNEHNIGTYTTTIKKDGKYQVSGIVAYSEDFTDGKYADLYLLKNGAAYTLLRQTLGVTVNPAISFSVMMQLSANDTLQVGTLHNHTEARKVYASRCRFSVIKVA